MSPTRTVSTATAPPGQADARSRLLDAGLRLFAQQGYAETSTRELAEAAGVNIASISYYFGDKAGLYRAVFLEPMKGRPSADELARIGDPAQPLESVLAAFYDGFLEPLKEGEVSRQCMKLHFREMLEPTGLWDEEVAHGIRPVHDALVARLQVELGLTGARGAKDDDLLRLALSIEGLGVHMHVGRDVIDTLAPGLTDTPADFDRWRERLVMYARAMIEAERMRRAGQPPSPPRAARRGGSR